jgi:hypothetical protein
MSSSIYFVNGAPPPQRDPSNGVETFEVMRGRWTDGTPMTEGGSGYNPGSSNTTPFAFTGNPVTAAYWSMRCPNQPCGTPFMPQDMRLVGSTDLALPPGEARTLDVAILYGRASNNLQSITALRSAADFAQLLYDSGGLFPPASNPPVATESGASSAAYSVELSPNPADGPATVHVETPSAGPVRVEVRDMLGRRVEVVSEGHAPRGSFEVSFDAGRLAPGVYIVTIDAAAGRAARTFTVMR